MKKELLTLSKSLRIMGMTSQANKIIGILKKSEYIEDASDDENNLLKIINLDLPENNNEQGQKLYLPIAEVLIGYIISEVSKFLLEETVSKIKSQIYDLGLDFGIKTISFEIFKFFFKDRDRLLKVEKSMPNFLKIMKENSGIIPEFEEKEVEKSEELIEHVKSEIMKSDKPFKVDVNSIIFSYIEDYKYE